MQRIYVEEDVNEGWTDTDTIHYRLEAEQIPGFKRACSYQLGEMRLMIYVRLASSGSNEAVIKSVELESVKYQATGIGGMLANKQNCFDDFCAAAQYLTENKYTNPNK